MDRNRSTRFDDGRRGESYRPMDRRSPRADLFSHRSPPRHRSPTRPSADTWVPSDERSAPRTRSRSPFRRRSPLPFRSRDCPNGHDGRNRSPKRFSPHRGYRPRSPGRSSRRSRSPSNIPNGRSSPPRGPRLRSPLPNQRYRDFTARDQRSPPRRGRPASPARSRYEQMGSPSRRNPSPDRQFRSLRHRSRSPHADIHQHARSQSWRRQSYSPDSRVSRPDNGYKPGSSSTSRRSSPRPSNIDRSHLFNNESRDRSPRSSNTVSRESRSLAQPSSFHSRSPTAIGESKAISTPASQSPPKDPKKTGPLSASLEKPSHSIHFALRDNSPSRILSTGEAGAGACQDHRSDTQKPSRPPPTQPRVTSATCSSSPPSGPASYQSLTRNVNPAYVPPSTRPRGSFGGREFNQRRGSLYGPTNGQGRGYSYDSTGPSTGPPTGPRSSFGSASGPSAFDTHRSTFRAQSGNSMSFPRAPRPSPHLTNIPSLTQGGRLAPSCFDPLTEKRLFQLEGDRDKLIEQVEDKQHAKRSILRDWDRLEKESILSSLRSELAESHLQRMSGIDDLSSGVAF